MPFAHRVDTLRPMKLLRQTLCTVLLFLAISTRASNCGNAVSALLAGAMPGSIAKGDASLSERLLAMHLDLESTLLKAYEPGQSIEVVATNFEHFLDLRRNLVRHLRELQRGSSSGLFFDSATNEAFSRDLSFMADNLELAIFNLNSRKQVELRRIHRSRAPRHEWDNVVSDLRGSLSESYVMLHLNFTHHGFLVKLLPGFERFDRMQLKELAVANGIEGRLMDKEIDFVLGTQELTWVEVKNVPSMRMISGDVLWKKINSQLRDHLELMHALKRGFVDAQAGKTILQQNLVELRYYFMGTLQPGLAQAIESAGQAIQYHLQRIADLRPEQFIKIRVLPTL